MLVPRAADRLMLHFYGFVLADERTGRLERDVDPEERLENLNYSAHNWLRVSRIITSLGEVPRQRLEPRWPAPATTAPALASPRRQLGFARYKQPLIERLEAEVASGAIGNAARSCEDCVCTGLHPAPPPASPCRRGVRGASRVLTVWKPLVTGEGEAWYAGKTLEEPADREECVLFQPGGALAGGAAAASGGGMATSGGGGGAAS